MTGILVNISDHPTLPLKRKQEVFCFKPDWRGEGTVEVFLQLHHYEKLEDNSYGPEVTSRSINNYESKLVASNNIKVDPADGMELYRVVVQEASEGQEEIVEWRRYDNNQAVANFIGQFDFFDAIIRTDVVQIKQMLERFIQLNDIVKQRWNQ
jgi:hypothetical protein